MRDLSSRYDEVVVDMGSGDVQGIEALMRVANLIVVPCSQMDGTCGP